MIDAAALAGVNVICLQEAWSEYLPFVLSIQISVLNYANAKWIIANRSAYFNTTPLNCQNLIELSLEI